MKSTSKFSKICFCLALVLLIAFSFSSCKKTDKGNESNNASLLVNQEAVKSSSASGSEKNPIVVVPVPEIKDENPAVSSAVETKTEAEPAKTEVTKTEEAKKPESPVFVSDSSSNNDEAESNGVVAVSPVAVSAPVSVELVEAPIEATTAAVEEIPKTIETVNDSQIAIDDVYTGTWPVVASFAYGGVDTSINIEKDNASIVFNTFVPSEDEVRQFVEVFVGSVGDIFSSCIYTLDGNTIHLTYPEGSFGDSSFVRTNIASLIPAAKEAIDSFKISPSVESESISQNYLLYGKKVTITAQKDKAVITSDAPFTSGEINEALEILRANFPEETKYVYYTPYADRIEIVYPEVSMEYVTAALKAFDVLILAYTPMPIGSMALLDETSDVDATTETPEPVAEPLSTTSPENVAKAAKTLSNFSVSLAPRMSLDFSNSQNPFTFGIDARGEYKVNSSFSVGLSLGYGFNGYIPVSIYGKYYFREGFGLYGIGRVGANIGLGDNATDFLLGIGAGYEYNILDDLTVFAEFDISLNIGNSTRFVPSLTIGGRYTF